MVEKPRPGFIPARMTKKPPSPLRAQPLGAHAGYLQGFHGQKAIQRTAARTQRD
jgi:hypothetical protein